MARLIDRERRRRTLVYVTITGAFWGVLYPVLAREFDRPIAFINGLAVGSIGGFLVSLLEVYVFRPKRHRYSFFTSVLLKSLVYFTLFAVLIVVIMNFNESVYYGTSILANFRSERFQTFLFHGDYPVILAFALAAVIIVIFIRELSRKMGQGVFVNFLTGIYYKPSEVERIFLFLDQRDSTRMTEEISSLGFYRFLNEFYFDITKCILSTYGVIYRYIGDQLIVSWTVNKGLKDANCLRCYYRILEEVEVQRSKYETLYGAVPNFRVSMHIGTVVRGEIGDVKSQISYHGEAIHETNKIEEACRTAGADLLLSEQLLERIELPEGILPRELKRIEGENNDLVLFTLDQPTTGT